MDGKSRRRATWRSILAFALVIPFFLGVILIYYTMLYSETREKIIKGRELSAVTSAEQIDKYLSKGIDTMRLASFTLDKMIRSGKSQNEIHDFLVNQSTAIENITMDSSTGVYGFISGEYLDGTDWVPDADYVPTDRPWYIEAMANVGRVAVVDPYVKQNGRNGYSFYQKDSDSADMEKADVGKLVSGIRSSGNYEGAMDVEYRQFARLHEYISNLEKRFSHPFQLILISLDGGTEDEADRKELEKAMYFMEQSIRQTIRNVDVVTRYNRRQFLIILLGTGAGGVKPAVDRIFRGYYKMYGSSIFSPSYSVEDVHSSDVPE